MKTLKIALMSLAMTAALASISFADCGAKHDAKVVEKPSDCSAEVKAGCNSAEKADCGSKKKADCYSKSAISDAEAPNVSVE